MKKTPNRRQLHQTQGIRVLTNFGAPAMSIVKTASNFFRNVAFNPSMTALLYLLLVLFSILITKLLFLFILKIHMALDQMVS